jgi:hypothetical protein
MAQSNIERSVVGTAPIAQPDLGARSSVRFNEEGPRSDGTRRICKCGVRVACEKKPHNEIDSCAALIEAIAPQF